MKRALQFSLLLNVLLLGFAWRRSARPPPIPRQPRTEVGERLKNSFQRISRSQTAAPQPPTPWDALEAALPAEFIARLRAIGCPEQTIRDIVTFRLCREHRNRWLAAEVQATRSWNYTRNRDQREWRNQNHERTELRNEMISTSESLFNESWGTLTTTLLGWPEGGNQMAFLSVEKRRQIRELDERYRFLGEDLERRRFTGDLDADDLTRMREWDLQKRAELETMLSPPELKEYLYRQSPAADYVRNILPPAKSEGEFRAMVKVALELEMSNTLDSPAGRYGLADPGPTDVQRDREQRKAAFDQRLKEVLGEERVVQQQAEEQARAERERQQSARAELVATAESAGVNAEEAGRFYDRLKELEPDLNTKFEELEKSLAGTPEEKQKQMEAAVKKELERIAVETIGEKGRAIVEKMAEHGK